MLKRIAVAFEASYESSESSSKAADPAFSAPVSTGRPISSPTSAEATGVSPGLAETAARSFPAPTGVALVGLDAVGTPAWTRSSAVFWISFDCGCRIGLYGACSPRSEDCNARPQSRLFSGGVD
jgi:hypothetical protein